MTWIYVGGYILLYILTFRRTLYLWYNWICNRDMDGEGWFLGCLVAFLTSFCCLIVYPAFLGYSLIKTLHGYGLRIPMWLVMSVPKYERDKVKRENLMRQIYERDNRIAQLESELGIR